MSAHQTLLAEAVAHGLDEGWWAAKRRAVQPTKNQPPATLIRRGTLPQRLAA